MAGRSERILITGAQGFTGRALVRHLRAAGQDVVTLEDAGHGYIDLCNRDAVASACAALQPELVYHLAGIATNLHPDVGQIYQVNVVGTAHLLAGLKALPRRPRGVILASSVTVYAPPPGGGCLDETAPLRPPHHYGSSKLAAEEVARHFSRDLPILVVRPFNYTGPGQSEDFVVAKLVQHFARRDTVIRMGNVDIARDFMALETVVEVYRRLGQLDEMQGVVNIASGRAISLREILATLETLTGHAIRIETDPRFVRADEVSVLFGATDTLHRLIGPVDHPPFATVLAAMLDAACQPPASRQPA
jgi:nucleoside-diphosphate-sugar epimerase